MKKIWSIGLIAILCLVGYSIWFSHGALAAWGRANNVGYFTGAPAAGGNNPFVPFPPANYDGLGPNCQSSANTPAASCNITFNSFLATYQNRLYDATSLVDRGRAAGEIDIMLDEPGTDFGSIQAGITYAQDNFARWESLVTEYNSGTIPGYSVNFDKYMYFPVGITNTLGVVNKAGGSFLTCTAAQGCIGDLESTVYTAPGNDWAVVFTYPGGQFVIKHKCANLTGDNSGLKIPPTTYTCGNANLTPGIIQPGDAFTTTISDNYQTGPPTFTNFEISIPSIGYTNDTATPLTETPATLKYTTPSLRAPPAAGTYPISWQLFDNGNPEGPVCNEELIVTDLPYFEVYGADISSGGDFASCTNNGGTISSWYDNSPAIKAGASAQFAAIAQKNVTGFGSSQNAGAGPPNGASMNILTFANSAGVIGSTPSNVSGGNYGGTHCLYLPVTPPGSPTNDVASGATMGSSLLVSGVHGHSGNMQLNGGTIPATASGSVGNSLALYVTGDVYITSNIIYGSNSGSWTINSDGTSNVPSFTLVATGNIYIAPSVTELDGVYIAQKGSSSGGTIYTCGQVNYTPLAAASLYSTCARQLTVYGSFIADQVNLMRTFGTLDDATDTDSPWSPTTHACANGNAAPVCAAEVFNFSPDLYLSHPAVQPPGNSGVTYDSISNLPPAL